MALTEPERLHIVADDGASIGAVRWAAAASGPTVVAAHGITANAWSWAAVARHLDREIGLVALDLRGRGRSAAAPGPYGMRRHADDIAAAIAQVAAAPAVLVGHSMGAHVALACAERHPAAVAGLVLVDGGPPITLPDGLGPQQALDAIVGPAIARLRVVWRDRDAYRAMWSEHPAFAGGLTPEVERYVLSDLAPCDGGLRSVISEVAVRFDGEELLADAEVRALLDRRAEPATIIRAETGLMAAPPPFVSEEWIDRYPQHDWRFVPGTNHYSVLIGDAGAAVVADALRAGVNSLR